MRATTQLALFFGVIVASVTPINGRLPDIREATVDIRHVRTLGDVNDGGFAFGAYEAAYYSVVFEEPVFLAPTNTSLCDIGATIGQSGVRMLYDTMSMKCGNATFDSVPEGQDLPSLIGHVVPISRTTDPLQDFFAVFHEDVAHPPAPPCDRLLTAVLLLSYRPADSTAPPAVVVSRAAAAGDCTLVLRGEAETKGQRPFLTTADGREVVGAVTVFDRRHPAYSTVDVVRVSEEAARNASVTASAHSGSETAAVERLQPSQSLLQSKMWKPSDPCHAQSVDLASCARHMSDVGRCRAQQRAYMACQKRAVGAADVDPYETREGGAESAKADEMRFRACVSAGGAGCPGPTVPIPPNLGLPPPPKSLVPGPFGPDISPQAGLVITAVVNGAIGKEIREQAQLFMQKMLKVVPPMLKKMLAMGIPEIPDPLKEIKAMMEELKKKYAAMKAMAEGAMAAAAAKMAAMKAAAEMARMAAQQAMAASMAGAQQAAQALAGAQQAAMAAAAGAAGALAAAGAAAEKGLADAQAAAKAAVDGAASAAAGAGAAAAAAAAAATAAKEKTIDSRAELAEASAAAAAGKISKTELEEVKARTAKVEEAAAAKEREAEDANAKEAELKEKYEMEREVQQKRVEEARKKKEAKMEEAKKRADHEVARAEARKAKAAEVMRSKLSEVEMARKQVDTASPNDKFALQAAKAQEEMVEAQQRQLEKAKASQGNRTEAHARGVRDKRALETEAMREAAAEASPGVSASDPEVQTAVSTYKASQAKKKAAAAATAAAAAAAAATASGAKQKGNGTASASGVAVADGADPRLATDAEAQRAAEEAGEVAAPPPVISNGAAAVWSTSVPAARVVTPPTGAGFKSQAYPPVWVEVVLPADQPVTGVRLTFRQCEPGETRHVVYAIPGGDVYDPESEEFRVGEVEGKTRDGQGLTIEFTRDASERTRRVRVKTVEGNCEVEWGPIAVLGDRAWLETHPTAAAADGLDDALEAPPAKRAGARGNGTAAGRGAGAGDGGEAAAVAAPEPDPDTAAKLDLSDGAALPPGKRLDVRDTGEVALRNVSGLDVLAAHGLGAKRRPGEDARQSGLSAEEVEAARDDAAAAEQAAREPSERLQSAVAAARSGLSLLETAVGGSERAGGDRARSPHMEAALALVQVSGAEGQAAAAARVEAEAEAWVAAEMAQAAGGRGRRLDAAASRLEGRVAARGWLREEAGRRRGGDGSGDAAVFLETMSEPGWVDDIGKGSIAKTMTKDLVHQLTEKLSAMVTDEFTKEMTPALHASLVDPIRAATSGYLAEHLLESVGTALPKALAVAVPHAIERLLPAFLLKKLVATTTATMTRALTHTLTPTLIHSLSYSPNEQYYCFYCQQEKKFCQYCHHSPKEIAASVKYADFYAAYYSDYYADMYA